MPPLVPGVSGSTRPSREPARARQRGDMGAGENPDSRKKVMPSSPCLVFVVVVYVIGDVGIGDRDQEQERVPFFLPYSGKMMLSIRKHTHREKLERMPLCSVSLSAFHFDSAVCFQSLPFRFTPFRPTSTSHFASLRSTLRRTAPFGSVRYRAP